MRAERRKSITNKTGGPITAYVLCSGRNHRITLTPAGAIVLHDHGREEIRAELAISALGGLSCRCVELLKQWRQTPTLLPEPFHTARMKTIRIQDREPDPLEKPFVQRVCKRIAQMAQEMTRDTVYRRSNAHGTYVWVYPPRPISEYGGTVRPTFTVETGLYNREKYTLWYVNIPLRWIRLYLKGAALVDGIFILDLEEELPDGSLRVVAARQGRGYKLYPAPAILTRNASGGWKLKWEKGKHNAGD